MGLLAILLSLAGIGVALCLPSWIRGPVTRAAKTCKHPRQFMLVDFLALFVLIQLWMALVHAIFLDEAVQGQLVLDAFGWIVLGLLWWVCVQTLSRAGVRGAWRRGAFLAIVLPLTVAGTFTVAAYSVTLPMIVMETLRYPHNRGPMLAILASGVPLFGILYAAGRFTRWIAARAETEIEAAGKTAEDEDFTQAAD